jgi:thiamine-phosphate pyrophosphorylase
MNYLRPYHFISNYNKKELESLNNKINIIYRNYKDPIKESVIIKVKSECQKSRKKLFLSNNIKMAIKLKLDGVYIPSFNKSLNLKFKTNKHFQILGSAHNLKEIRIKEKQGIDKIFLSPIFKVNKKKHYFDIHKFKKLSKLTKKKIVALGGINEKNIKRIKLLNCDGFAAIKYFRKNKIG